MEVILGHIFGHGEVRWPPICLKHWKVGYWSHYLSFDMSNDMGYVSHCCGHAGHLRSGFRSWWGQMTSNWYTTMKGQILKSLPFIWYVTWHGIRKSHCCGHGGHLRSSVKWYTPFTSCQFWPIWGSLSKNSVQFLAVIQLDYFRVLTTCQVKSEFVIGWEKKINLHSYTLYN